MNPNGARWSSAQRGPPHSARAPRNTHPPGCGPAWGRRHPRAHTGITVRARACTHRLRHIHACMCSWRLAHELTLGRACTHAHRSIHTHVHVWSQAINGQVHRDTAPSSPSQNRVTYMHTNNAPEPQRYSRVRHTHSPLPPSLKGAPTSCTPSRLQSFLSTPPARPQPQPLPPPEFPGQLSTECPAWDRPFLSHYVQLRRRFSLKGPLHGDLPQTLGSREALVIAQEVSAPFPSSGPTSTPTSTWSAKGALLGWGRGEKEGGGT